MTVSILTAAQRQVHNSCDAADRAHKHETCLNISSITAVERPLLIALSHTNQCRDVGSVSTERCACVQIVAPVRAPGPGEVNLCATTLSSRHSSCLFLCQSLIAQRQTVHKVDVPANSALRSLSVCREQNAVSHKPECPCVQVIVHYEQVIPQVTLSLSSVIDALSALQAFYLASGARSHSASCPCIPSLYADLLGCTGVQPTTTKHSNQARQERICT